MMDPAVACDAFLDWWASIAFKRGFLVGFVICMALWWMAG